MRLQPRTVSLFLMGAALLSSCAEEAFVDYSLVEPKLVVQSRLSPDTSFQVHLSSNLIPVDNSGYRIPSPVEVTLVTLSTGSVVNLYLENGVFVAPQTYPQAGESYKIYVNAQGFPLVEATTSIPQPVELDNGRIYNLRMVESDVTPDKMNVTYNLLLNFKPHTHRYFHFSFLQSTTINVGTVTEPKLDTLAYVIDPQYPNEDGFYQHHETGVLIDAQQTQTARTIDFSFVDYTLGDLEELGNLYIEVKTVTEEYYLYHTSLSRQLISRQDPFAEPIPVFNNIQDGTGNFSGFSRLFYQIPVLP